MTLAISIDGAVVAPEAAAISVLDRGLLYGDGVFEVLRTWLGVAVDLDAHLDRMAASAAALELRLPSRDALAAQVAATLAAAGEGDHRVRLLVTRGPGPLGARFASLGPGRAIAIAEPLAPQPTELALATVDWPLPPRVGPAHKTLAYLDHVIARELAARAGADEAVRLDPAGDVVEGATSNVFAVIAGAVVTPPLRGTLPGVTRARVLAACARRQLAAVERAIARAELAAADEIFVTSAVRGVVAVTRLDGVSRAAGPITAALAAEYTSEMCALARRR